MKAAVFSGGGVKGAFQLGCLVNYWHNKPGKIDGFFGVSTGSLTSSVLAQASTYEDQITQLDNLLKIYRGIQGNSSIYSGSQWPPLEVAHWLFGSSIFNPSGLTALLDKVIDVLKLNTSSTKFGCGVTCLETGEYSSMSNTNQLKVIKSYILASASMPVFFPAVEIDGKHYIDGGVRNITPLKEAVKWLKTFPNEQNELIIFLASPLGIKPYTGSSKGPSAAARILDMIETEIYENDLRSLMSRNREPKAGDVNITGTMFVPTQLYGSALDFNPITIEKMISNGMSAIPLTVYK